ncbi:MAG: hypothetical protein LBP21_04875 [Synergistaceae bacterium]|jgi:hypothetical protein|nr:hypothetical protein [Synergistaceae bacterium]
MRQECLGKNIRTHFIDLMRLGAFFSLFFAFGAAVAWGRSGAMCLPPIEINKTVICFAGHEWVVTGYDDRGVYPRADSLTLLLKNDDAGGGFGNVENRNAKGEYVDGNLWAAMDALADGFNADERALVNVRELTGERDSIAGSKHQLLWPLSLEEWGTIDDTSVRAYGEYWQLRSKFDSPFAGDKSGSNGGSLVGIPSSCAIRPALSLSLSSVVFAPYARGAALKLTVVDNDNLSLSVKDCSERILRSGAGTLSIPYSGAKTGANKAVTAVIADARSGAQMLYRRADCAEGGKADGTFSLAAPDSTVLPGGRYRLFIFNEQMNADRVTNTASTPVEIPLTADDGKPPSVVASLPDEIYETTPGLELIFSEMVTAAPGKKITITSVNRYSYVIEGNELSSAIAGRSTAKISFGDFKDPSGEPLPLKVGMKCSVRSEAGAFTDMTGNKTPENMSLAAFVVTEPIIIY